MPRAAGLEFSNSRQAMQLGMGLQGLVRRVPDRMTGRRRSSGPKRPARGARQELRRRGAPREPRSGCPRARWSGYASAERLGGFTAEDAEERRERAKSEVRRTESEKQRAKSEERRAKSKERRAKSGEQRAKREARSAKCKARSRNCDVRNAAKSGLEQPESNEDARERALLLRSSASSAVKKLRAAVLGAPRRAVVAVPGAPWPIPLRPRRSALAERRAPSAERRAPSRVR